MSGHSKWNNIKRRKGAVDAQRGKLFTKLGREIQVAVKSGGPDPDSNTTLKDVIAKAKANNMPNDSIKRSISRASGADSTDDYEEVLYEGYGPGGVAVMVRALTDNRNRTAGEVRHTFDKHGGNLGTNGCVAFLFEKKGSLVLDRAEFDDEEQVMMDALEAGAEDIVVDEEMIEIVTSPEDYSAVRNQLEKNYTFADVSLGPVAITEVELTDDDQIKKMNKLIDMMEDNDDVQEVFHNWSQSE